MFEGAPLALVMAVVVRLAGVVMWLMLSDDARRSHIGSSAVSGILMTTVVLGVVGYIEACRATRGLARAAVVIGTVLLVVQVLAWCAQPWLDSRSDLYESVYVVSVYAWPIGIYVAIVGLAIAAGSRHLVMSIATTVLAVIANPLPFMMPVVNALHDTAGSIPMFVLRTASGLAIALLAWDAVRDWPVRRGGARPLNVAIVGLGLHALVSVLWLAGMRDSWPMLEAIALAVIALGAWRGCRVLLQPLALTAAAMATWTAVVITGQVQIGHLGREPHLLDPGWWADHGVLAITGLALAVWLRVRGRATGGLALATAALAGLSIATDGVAQRACVLGVAAASLVTTVIAARAIAREPVHSTPDVFA